MYVRDARGGMRPVLTESHQLPLSYQQPGSHWSARRAHTPSEYDTLPRGDIGGRPRLIEQQRSLSHFSLPQATIPSSVRSRNRNVRLRSSHRYSENDLPSDDVRPSNRNKDGLRSRVRPNRSLEHGISTGNRQKGLSENMLAASKGSFAARVDRPRSLTPDGRMSARSNGSINRRKSHLIPKPEAAWKYSQARLDERYSSLGYNTPSMLNGHGYNSRASGRIQSPPLQYSDRRGFEAAQGQGGTRQYTIGREYTAVDPQLEEAETRSRQYYVGMNLNATAAQPGFNQSASQYHRTSGSGMYYGNGRDSRYEPQGSYYDSGFYNSRINLVDYNPPRPNSRSVSVMQLGDDRRAVYGSRSVLDGYDEGLIHDSYVVDVRGSLKSRPTSRMTVSRVRDSRARPGGDEKIDFDFELIGGDGGRNPVAGGRVMNGASIGTPRPSTALSDYRLQNTASRLSSYTLPGDERWLTMQRDDTLTMDYQPRETEMNRTKPSNGRPVSRAGSQKRAVHRSTSFMDEARESFSRQSGRKTPDERSILRRKSWNSRPTSRIDSQRFSRASNRFPSYEDDRRPVSSLRVGEGNKLRERSWYGSTGSLGDSRRHRWSHRIRSYDDDGEIVRDETWQSRPTSRVDSQRFSRASNRFPSYEEDRKSFSSRRERDQDNDYNLREKSFLGSTGSIGEIHSRRRRSYRINYDDDKGTTSEPIRVEYPIVREVEQNGDDLGEELWNGRPTSSTKVRTGDIERSRRSSSRISYNDKDRFSRASNRYSYYDDDREPTRRDRDLIRDEGNKLREKSQYGSIGSIGEIQRRRRTSYRINYDDDANDEDRRDKSDVIDRDLEQIHDEISKVREELENSRPTSRIDSQRYSRASNRLPSYEEERYSTSRQGRLGQDAVNRDLPWSSRPTSRIDSQSRLSRTSQRSAPYREETRNSLYARDDGEAVKEESWYSSSTGSDGETRRHHTIVRRGRSYDDEEEEETRETISRQVDRDDLDEEKEKLEQEKRRLREDMEDERRRLHSEIEKMHEEQGRAEDERLAERKSRDWERDRKERERRYEEDDKNRW